MKKNCSWCSWITSVQRFQLRIKKPWQIFNYEGLMPDDKIWDEFDIQIFEEFRKIWRIVFKKKFIFIFAYTSLRVKKKKIRI